MAIRFKYDVGAGIIGAFAAGQAANRRRRQKYGYDILLQQQQHRNRMAEMFARQQAFGAIGGARRARAGAAVGQGRFIDPLDEALEARPQNNEAARRGLRVQQRAQARAAARSARLGRDFKGGDLLPRFQTPEEVAAEQAEQAAAADEAQFRRQQQGRLDLQNDQQEFLDRRDRRDLALRQRQLLVANLTPIPEHVAQTNPELHRQLVKAASGIRQLALGDDVDFDAPDGDAQDKLDEAIDSYETMLDNVGPPPEPRPPRRFTENGVDYYYDQKNQPQLWPKPEAPDTSKEDAAAAKQVQSREDAVMKKFYELEAESKKPENAAKSDEQLHQEATEWYERDQTLRARTSPSGSSSGERVIEYGPDGVDVGSLNLTSTGQTSQPRREPSYELRNLSPNTTTMSTDPSEAVKAARAGDVKAQEALERRRIDWRTYPVAYPITE